MVLLCRHAVYWPYPTWISSHFTDVESHWCVTLYFLRIGFRRIFSASPLPFKIRCGPLEGTVLGAELCIHDTPRSISETLDMMSKRAVGGGHIGSLARLVSLICCIPVQLGGPTTRYFFQCFEGTFEGDRGFAGIGFWKAPRACKIAS